MELLYLVPLFSQWYIHQLKDFITFAPPTKFIQWIKTGTFNNNNNNNLFSGY